MPATNRHKRLRWVYLALALMEVFAIEVPGARDYAEAPYAGYELSAESANDFNSDYLMPRVIAQVRPDSPAERAGLQIGDQVLAVQGIPYEDQESVIKLGRPKIGESRTLVVARDGKQMQLELTYAKNPTNYNFKYAAFAVIAFAFLSIGATCFWLFPSRTTNLLFWLGLAGAFVFMHKPYFASFAVRSAFSMLRWLITSLWLAFLVHFLLIFPKPKSALIKKPKLALGAIYSPCLLLFLVIAYYTFFPSGVASHGGIVINIAFLFIGGYLAFGVVAFIQTYRALPAGERTRGMRIMALATAIGILPIALSIIIVIIAPQIPLPGRDYYILMLVLIPLSFGYAVREQMKGIQGEAKAAQI